MKDCTSCIHGSGGGSDVYCKLGLRSVYMTDTDCQYYAKKSFKPLIYEIWEIKKIDSFNQEKNRLGVYKEYETARKKFEKYVNTKYILIPKELDG